MVKINFLLGIHKYNVLFYYDTFILPRTDLIHHVRLKCFGRLYRWPEINL
jgi:hypothetical protein